MSVLFSGQRFYTFAEKAQSLAKRSCLRVDFGGHDLGDFLPVPSEICYSG